MVCVCARFIAYKAEIKNVSYFYTCNIAYEFFNVKLKRNS